HTSRGPSLSAPRPDGLAGSQPTSTAPAQYRSPHPSTRQVDLLSISVARRAGKCKTDQTTQRRKTMALEVRRIVTGHDANGKAIVKTDERLQAVSPLARPPIARRAIWSTDKTPGDKTSQETPAAQRARVV